MLELGGNIYFTAKLGATDGHSFQHLAAVMTGSTQQDYADMMLAGGRSVEGNRSRSGRANPPNCWRRSRSHRQAEGRGKIQVAAKAQARSRSQAESQEPSRKPSPNPQQTEVTSWLRSSQASDRRTCPRSARRSTTTRPRSPTGSGCSRASSKSKEWMRERQARRRHRRLQRPRLGVLGRPDPDLRARLRGGIPARRRGLGAAAGAGREGPSGARRAYRAVGHPRRVRPHHRQQDGGRPRPHRAAQPAVRQGRPRRNGRSRSFRSPSTS